MNEQVKQVKQAREELLKLKITDIDNRLWTLRPMMYMEIKTREEVDQYFEDEAGDDDCSKEEAYQLVEWLNVLRNYPYDPGRETLTELALSLSLCPIHYCDYMGCFDDDDPECVQVRLIHPAHDT